MTGDAPPGLPAYASRPERSRGRAIAEPASPLRTAFQRDRDRVIHSAAFRRLALKTQVFIPDSGDEHRTRLTHTLEVAQIARTIARVLGLDEDLTEALALAHDLGHPPFGHTGEDALDRCLEAVGGFDHNAQTLRVVTLLERRYPAFDGLNLSWETLEGLIKRKGPLAPPSEGVTTASLREMAKRLDIDAETFASGEAQAAALADDIAYNAHDTEDGLAAGLFDLADLVPVAFVGEALREIAETHPGLDPSATARELTRRMIGAFVEDAIGESRRRLAATALASPWALRALGTPAVALSGPFARHSRAVKAFLRDRMYRHPSIVETRARAAAIVQNLVAAYVDAPEGMPPEWAARARNAPDGPSILRTVGDCVAAMTDRGAVREHCRLFGTTPDLR